VLCQKVPGTHAGSCDISHLIDRPADMMQGKHALLQCPALSITASWLLPRFCRHDTAIRLKLPL
jgi:hypothetical protein